MLFAMSFTYMAAKLGTETDPNLSELRDFHGRVPARALLTEVRGSPLRHARIRHQAHDLAIESQHLRVLPRRQQVAQLGVSRHGCGTKELITHNGTNGGQDQASGSQLVLRHLRNGHLLLGMARRMAPA